MKPYYSVILLRINIFSTQIDVTLICEVCREIAGTEIRKRNKKTPKCCTNWGQLYWHKQGHPPNKHTHTHSMKGFLTVKYVLLHCFLWVENYSGPYRFNDKLSKRQHVCQRAHKQQHSVGNHIYGQVKMQIHSHTDVPCCSWMTSSWLKKQRLHIFTRGTLPAVDDWQKQQRGLYWLQKM